MPAIAHRTIAVDDVEIFYRDAGPPDAPVVLLPHGYPASSFQYRTLMPALADRWHLIAPDFPGFGLSATPDPADFDYTFAGYAAFLERFVETMGLSRFAIYLHDYGSQIGLRLAMRRPEWIAALVIQNGDAYEDTLGPKYDALKAYWADPTAERREQLAGEVSEAGLRREFLGELPDRLIPLVSPDLWHLAWPLMDHPVNRRVMVDLFTDIETNVRLYPEFQRYFREHQPPTLIAWGPMDGYMPEPSARAYLRDLPEAELHLLDGGHWALETNLDEIIDLMRDFLGRVHLA